MKRKNRIFWVNAHFLPAIPFTTGNKKTARTSCLQTSKYPADIPKVSMRSGLSFRVNIDYPCVPTFFTSTGSGYLSNNNMDSNSISNTCFNPQPGTRHISYVGSKYFCVSRLQKYSGPGVVFYGIQSFYTLTIKSINP